MQSSREKLDAPGLEGGLFDPNTTHSIAGYMFNELRFNADAAHAAGRSHRKQHSQGHRPRSVRRSRRRTSGASRSFTPLNGAVGFLQDLPGDLVASVTYQHVERAPRAPELLSRGVHEATGTFDIGNPNLKTELANSVEVGLRRAKGPLRFEATGVLHALQRLHLSQPDRPDLRRGFRKLRARQWRRTAAGGLFDQRDATFRGAEVQAQYDVAPILAGVWGVDGRYDIVRATFTDGTNVPRIPPQRLGGGVYYRDGNWFARVGLLHAFPQNDVSDFETDTGGYDLLKAELSYTSKLPGDPSGLAEVKFGVVGDNLLNDDVRFAQSFKKDEVLQPGRTVKLFATVKF